MYFNLFNYEQNTSNFDDFIGKRVAGQQEQKLANCDVLVDVPTIVILPEMAVLVCCTLGIFWKTLRTSPRIVNAYFACST